MTYDDYVKTKKKQLYFSIKEIKKIYVDTKYWVEMCDVSLGKKSDDTIQEIAKRCKELADTNKAIFPISYRTFIEVLGQTDKTTLMKTIEIIDRLSKGIAIISEYERYDLELLYFIQKSIDENSVDNPEMYVWSKVFYIMGHVAPDLPLLDTNKNNEIKKKFLDFTWNLTFSDFINNKSVDNIKSFPKHKDSDFSEILTSGKKNAIKENKSRHSVYVSEIAGILDANKDRIDSLLKYLFIKKYPERKQSLKESNTEIVQSMMNLIYHAFDNDKMESYLPSWDIMARLHTEIRWDTNRRYRSNDLNDIGHSMTALPYFDYFFTERSFTSLIKQCEYDKKYSCIVEFKPENVLHELNILRDA